MIKQLPVGDFRFHSDGEIASFDIMKVDPAESTGYLVQVNLSYPFDFHNLHSDLPLVICE